MISNPLDLPVLQNEPGTLEAVREMRAYANNLETAMSVSKFSLLTRASG